MSDDFDYSLFFASGFKQFLRNAMAAQQVSVSALAKASGVSRSYCGKLINPKMDPMEISMAKAYTICAALGFDLSKVLFALENQAPHPENRITKEEKPRIRAAAMALPQTKTVWVDPPEDVTSSYVQNEDRRQPDLEAAQQLIDDVLLN